MIADAIGVTKGAIYHQFNTKDEIIIAVAEMELARLEDALEAAESLDCRNEARELLLNLVIDHAVEHRRAANTLQFDPVIVRLLSEHEPFQSFIERLYGMLVGDEPGPDTQVRLAALTASSAARFASTRRRPRRRNAAPRTAGCGKVDRRPSRSGTAPDGPKPQEASVMDAGAGAMVSTAMRVVNAIPYVVHAKPGLLSALDLPLTLPRNVFR